MWKSAYLNTAGKIRSQRINLLIVLKRAGPVNPHLTTSEKNHRWPCELTCIWKGFHYSLLRVACLSKTEVVLIEGAHTNKNLEGKRALMIYLGIQHLTCAVLGSHQL